MTPKRMSTFRIDDELIEGLESIRSQDPEWSVSRQVREAIKEWLEKHGVALNTGPRLRQKRAAKTSAGGPVTRKRSR
jgi:Arc/MetJ-type ribon-helix-helix transcriptional regulator